MYIIIILKMCVGKGIPLASAAAHLLGYISLLQELFSSALDTP